MTNKLSVLCVGRDMRGGGAERVQAALLRSLDRDRIRLTAAYMSGQGPLRAELPTDLEVHYGAFGRLPKAIAALAFLKRLIALARRHDLIFGMQEGSPIYLAALAGVAARRPVIGWLHNLWSRLTPLAGWWNLATSESVYPLTSGIVCVSREVSCDLAMQLPSLRHRLPVLPNPLDVTSIRSNAQAEPPEWAHKWWTGKKILACGRLVPQKGFDLLLAVLARLNQRGHDCRLVILGEGPERGRLENAIYDLGLQNRVLLPGFLPNPYPVLRLADAFVLSSRFEGLGMVVLESMALGVPIVTFDSEGGGPREIIQDNGCGLLVPPGDIDKMAETMERLLSDGGLRGTCIAGGLARVQDYEAHRAALHFESLFLRTVSDARSG